MQSAKSALRTLAGVGARVLNSSSRTQVRGYRAPLRDMKFVTNEVYNIQDHYSKLKHVDGSAASPDMIDAVLDGFAKFAENDLAPMNQTADSEGCTWVSGTETKTPTGFKAAYDSYVEGGWQGLTYPEEYGGQGLPPSLAIISSELVATANWTWSMYPGLSKGAINTILAHGSPELKEKYLHKLVSSEWTGTMCLTEPHCGSDLAQVKTKAVPQGDGTYKITGTKIFISCGDHDLTDNIVHCVLARLPDAPEGTRGISLFAVPKKHVADDGTVGDYNNVKVGRIEDKMGCHGSSTCEINFEEAEGVLIGTENKGLNHMFTFINTSRLGTALQGGCAAELSYQLALDYAKERLAMRSLSGIKNPDGPADPIIVHPDVRKNLLFQKAISEGARSMITECCLLWDNMADAEAAGDTKAARKIDDRMGFLTPILKGFLTEVGCEAANKGIQIWGGHGYIKQNHMEQVFRDVRISAVWEGTTGIQALDLLGRKVLLQKLKPIASHVSESLSYLRGAMFSAQSSEMRSHAYTLIKAHVRWQYLTTRIAIKASSDKDFVGAASVDYLMYSGYVSMGQHWLKMEEAALKALKRTDLTQADKDFYSSKVDTARYYFDYVLPRSDSLATTMMTPTETFTKITNDEFDAAYN
ncbi:acyl-CoA dehydrogenase [Sphaeroforma arctica JP610]|uniref:Acyl-CoA dehydrogenase n=1 Tax=Sphaeroforma arctica JP610 TaxID=667725 RepID=A0A0L0FXJ9_9EUKA|nr:acyl-CoA dehydrogenase [Sphaeroforma arctica JP610]KNC80678.1 acyl-CoA dehydrogenase [Sphaeroforma arctica JP610]|eukprot:XP_014154580.1 acyl-CoA dehydrogenase [Sphaeroforma arctica JP610]